MIKNVYAKEIEELPPNIVLEEIRVCYQEKGEIRQRVILFGKIIGGKIFRTTKKGRILKKENFKNIKWLSFVKRL